MKEFQEILNYSFAQEVLLEQALTHKSFHNENRTQSTDHNERLEFLGDAVLDLSLSHFLMETYPGLPEGSLSKMRASLVNEDFLAELALKLKLNEKMRLGKGEAKSGGALKPRLLSSVFEAVVGALFLDAGFDRAHQCLVELFKTACENLELTEHQPKDYKTQLQEKVQAQFKVTPEYKLVQESGPDHEKSFEIEVRIGDKVLGCGEGKSKKQAEQQAAAKALEALQ